MPASRWAPWVVLIRSMTWAEVVSISDAAGSFAAQAGRASRMEATAKKTRREASSKARS